MMELINEFVCRDEAGNSYTVQEYQEIIQTPEYGNTNATVRGMKEFQLDTGEAVNYIDENTFQIVTTGTIIRR